MKKILVFNPFGIGDVLFSTPLIRNLKQHFREVSIYYLSNRRALPLLKNNTFIDKILVFEKDEWRDLAKQSRFRFVSDFFSFFYEVKREKFDAVFDLSLNSQYGFFFKMAGIKMRIGYNFKNRGRFFTHKIDLPYGYDDKHVARYYLGLLDFLNIKPAEYKYDLFLSKDSLIKGEEFLKQQGLNKDDLLVGVSAGSGDSWQSTAYFKRWPQDNFLELTRRITEDFNAKIILFGSKSETSLCDYIYNKAKVKPLNLCGSLSLEDFFSLVSFCKVIITNDGGPFHIAQALGNKAMVFFGPVDEKVYGVYPQGNNYKVLKKDIACRPCYKRFRFGGCDFNKKCLRDISIDEAFNAFKELLGASK